MNPYAIKDIAASTDRFKLFVLPSSPSQLQSAINLIRSENINVLNIGLELATYINSLKEHRYLYIDVYDYIKDLLDKNRSGLRNSNNDVVAIYNLGILSESRLQLNALQLLKEFSKTSALIIIWEDRIDGDKLYWSLQEKELFLDFSETKLKKLQHAI